MISNAILLAAGEGKRLRPFTLNQPKCLVTVTGSAILQNSLISLALAGCNDVRIVMGHCSDKIKQAIRSYNIRNMNIELIENREYATTNSMYSLALGLEGFDRATWVLEGDVMADPAIFTIPPAAAFEWFVDCSCRHLDGAYLEMEPSGRISNLVITKTPSELKGRFGKSIGLLRLERPVVQSLKRWLDRAIQAGRKNDYYDLIIRDHLASCEPAGVDVAGMKWFEIDSPQDLAEANRIFS
jgi:L-glutamine-phosphate cytidylyltransferase